MSTPTPTVGVVNGHTHSSPYGYTPSAAANITFLATFVFALFLSYLTYRILSLAHLVMGLKHRTWYFATVFVLGGLGYSSSLTLLTLAELIGYIGRVGSAFDVTLDIYFIIQICCLIFAPAFFSAGLYLAIGTLYVPRKRN